MPMSILRTIRDFVQGAGDAAINADLPAMSTNSSTMQIINIPLAIGGAVAALVVVSKYQPRRDDNPAEAMGRKVGAFFITGMPGIIVAQVAYDVAQHQFPALSKIPSLSLGAGLILGGCGLPIFLALREKLPEALTQGLLGWVQGKLQGKTTTTARRDDSEIPNNEPQGKDQ